MSQKQISNVRAHNERMRLLKEKNNDIPAFNVRQFSNPFMLASTQSLLTQLVAKSGGSGAVPTTSSSLGTVAQPFDATPTTKAETAPLAAESRVAAEAAKVFLSAQEKAEAADEARHAAHQAYKTSKAEYTKQSTAAKATLPAGWSMQNTADQLAAKLAENTAAYKKSQVDATYDYIEQMEEKQMGTGNTRARRSPAKYARLKHTLKMAEAHLKVMQQHNKDQVAAYKKTYATDKAKQAEGMLLHKSYQDALKQSRGDYAAAYEAQKAAQRVASKKAAVKTTAQATAASSVAAGMQKAVATKTKNAADAKAAAATSKLIPNTPDITKNSKHAKQSQDFVKALNIYKNKMAELAKSQKALSETETKQQLKRDEAELLKIRTDLAAAADKNNEHINSDFKPPLEQRGAFDKSQLAQYNKLDTEGKKQVGLAINRYTEARGNLIRYDAANASNKRIPNVNLSGKNFKQRRAEIKRSADAHNAYLTWAAEHQRLYQELVKARTSARKSLKSQAASTGGATESAAKTTSRSTKPSRSTRRDGSFSSGTGGT